MRKRERKKRDSETHYRKKYICYNSREEILIVGTAKECAEYLGIGVNTLQGRLSRQDESKRNPNSRKQYFVYALDDEDEIENIINTDSDQQEKPTYNEIWEQYKRTDYEVSTYGNVRHVYKTRSPKILSPWIKKPKKGSCYMAVKINGKETKIAKMIYETFIDTVPDGYSVVHIDGDFTNNMLDNLKILSRQECGRFGTAKQDSGRKVYDMDNRCYYKSAREAGKRLFMSYQTVINYCNKEVEKPMANLRWADEVEK